MRLQHTQVLTNTTFLCNQKRKYRQYDDISFQYMDVISYGRHNMCIWCHCNSCFQSYVCCVAITTCNTAWLWVRKTGIYDTPWIIESGTHQHSKGYDTMFSQSNLFITRPDVTQYYIEYGKDRCRISTGLWNHNITVTSRERLAAWFQRLNQANNKGICTRKVFPCYNIQTK